LDAITGAAKVTKESKYDVALFKIAFKALKRKMLANPPSIEDWVDDADMTAQEVWELVEALGDIALEALKKEPVQ
jgi:hypothetical protein